MAWGPRCASLADVPQPADDDMKPINLPEDESMRAVLCGAGQGILPPDAAGLGAGLRHRERTGLEALVGIRFTIYNLCAGHFLVGAWLHARGGGPRRRRAEAAPGTLPRTHSPRPRPRGSAGWEEGAGMGSAADQDQDQWVVGALLAGAWASPGVLLLLCYAAGQLPPLLEGAGASAPGAARGRPLTGLCPHPPPARSARAVRHREDLCDEHDVRTIHRGGWLPRRELLGL